jgi:hypothetical protein
MKKTAVEFLQEKFNNNNSRFITWSEDYFNEAKEMERQQIIDSISNANKSNNRNVSLNPEQYYNETFKK